MLQVSEVTSSRRCEGGKQITSCAIYNLDDTLVTNYEIIDVCLLEYVRYCPMVHQIASLITKCMWSSKVGCLADFVNRLAITVLKSMLRCFFAM